jgi:hypothetical protein
MGMVGAWYPIVLILAIIYQLLQYILDIRFFIFETTIRSGNSLIHTTVKLFEIFIGFLLGLLFKKYVKQ